ncbi:MAG: ribbon-helix-helix domain-containing protein [Bacteroidetes bacterium]|nr:MAG: ribbon-helix-helix domain-containing protein [Bacteroidota bacterium]MBL1145214.1 ribbon-helix-helix domain-containing protein [Bacteroidota bacterium]MCB0803618.1 ribbon-helix-helix domain-containing protein [Flavobacteriales bacterium]NOG58010.1 ribbon-helix-helix domain-containing protein [Bacteroidota bacterium]
MTTFTSSLPDELLAQLSEAAAKLSIPKNKIIEKALSTYLEQLKRIEYINSFKKAYKNEDTLTLAAEGMAAYLQQIED